MLENLHLKLLLLYIFFDIQKKLIIVLL